MAVNREVADGADVVFTDTATDPVSTSILHSQYSTFTSVFYTLSTQKHNVPLVFNETDN